MDKQEIIKLAREADLAEVADTLESLPIYYAESLIKFATMAYQRGVRDEREACIRDCMVNISPQAMAEGDWPQEAAEMVKFCIEDIRARGERDCV